MNTTLTACDKDSNQGFTATIEYQSKEDFLNQLKQFEEEVPFRRFYLEADDEQVQEWLE